MKRGWFLSGVIALVFGGVANAALVGTIAQINSAAAGTYCPAIYGTGCVQIGDKLFRGLSVGGIDAANVNIFNDGTTATDVFISFGGSFITGNSTVGNDFQIFYDVTALGGNLIHSIDQSFNLSAGNTGGTVTIGETVRSSFGGPLVAQSSVSFVSGVGDFEDPPAEGLQGDQLVITPGPLQRVWVSKDIHTIANVGGTVGATLLTQSFHQVPEPGQAAFLLGGCLIIGLYFKSRKRAQA